jgi:hypothetical protein
MTRRRWSHSLIVGEVGNVERALLKGYMDVVNISETDDQPPRKVVTRMSGESDPGYHLTLSKSRIFENMPLRSLSSSSCNASHAC